MLSNRKNMQYTKPTGKLAHNATGELVKEVTKLINLKKLMKRFL